MQEIYAPHKEIDVSGGESVYCINEAQMAKALGMVHADGDSAARMQDWIARAERDLSRNERAAIAFTLIQRLNASDD